jgi:regulator of protease activity HflC (stomatin/prohibitin superfamily)
MLRRLPYRRSVPLSMIQIGLRRSIRFAKGPGLIFLIPIVDRMVRMDLRVVTIDVARQEVMTRNNVPKTVDIVYFRIIDPAAAVVRVENYLKATSLISLTTLRSRVTTVAGGEKSFGKSRILRTVAARIE